jgi:hypothetical protein
MIIIHRKVATVLGLSNKFLLDRLGQMGWCPVIPPDHQLDDCPGFHRQLLSLHDIVGDNLEFAE